MERDFDTFDPNEALVDEGRNLYYPAGWQKGDTVFVLNDDGSPSFCYDERHGTPCPLPCAACEDEGCNTTELYEMEQRKGLDCE